MTIFISGCGPSPYIVAWPWNYGIGFGTKYANPSNLPSDSAVQIRTSGEDIVFYDSHDYSLVAYPFNESTGFGTKFAAGSPSPLGMDLHFSSDYSVAFMAALSTPFVLAYPFTEGVGFGTKYANPSQLVNTQTWLCRPRYDDNYVAYGGYTAGSVYVSAYDWDDGWGTLTQPASQGHFNVRGLSWTDDGYIIASCYHSTVGGDEYAWSFDSGVFGTRLSHSYAWGTAGPYDNEYLWSQNTIATAIWADGPSAWPWDDGAWGTKYTAPTDQYDPDSDQGYHSNGGDFFFSSSEGYDVVIKALPFVESTGWGTYYTNPVGLPGGTTTGIWIGWPEYIAGEADYSIPYDVFLYDRTFSVQLEETEDEIF